MSKSDIAVEKTAEAVTYSLTLSSGDVAFIIGAITGVLAFITGQYLALSSGEDKK